MGIKRHNPRHWTGHKRQTIRPDYEYCGIEIFSYDHQYTKTFHRGNYSFTKTNATNKSHRHLQCLSSSDEKKAFTVTMKYNSKQQGEYRIDLLYENTNGKDYNGEFNLINKPITFDGEKNIIKRKTFFVDFTEGTKTLTFTFPVNTYFIGVIVRRVIKFTADSEDSVDTTLALDDCQVTFSDMADPSEAQFSLFYDNAIECELSRSGYYIDYMDEVNVYFRENAEYTGKINRIFGGYVSSIKPDDDLTTLEISCGDRLLDGESKYILDLLLILNGTKDAKEMEYYNPINFNSYGELLKYLCDIYEVTLNSNINKNYLVQGEKYSKGFTIKFGKKKDVKKIATNNATATINKNMVTLRNKSSGKKKQVWTIYEAKKKPITLLTADNQPALSFHMTYGLGATKTSSESTTTGATDNSENTAGSQKFSKCGVSADKKYVMGIGQRSSRKDPSVSYSKITKSIFKNKCPHCGKATLRWKFGSNCSTGKSPVPETEITCATTIGGCGADYSIYGVEKDSPYKKLTSVGSKVESSRSEQKKLASGKLYAIPKSNTTVSPDSVFKAITKTAKQYKYTFRTSSTAQTYSKMKKTGEGDCWGFSDLIARELKSYGVACKIYQYDSGASSRHRVVVYKNANNEWALFPYSKYNLYPNKLGGNLKSALKGQRKVYYKGTTINNATSKSSTSTTTTKVTTTKGYDKDKPIQLYIRLVYSTTNSLSAKTKSVYLNFTQKAGTNSDLTGLSTVWINNTTRKTSVDMRGYFEENEPNKTIYLHRIEFVAPKIVVDENDENANTDWYTFNKSTHDYSSCKMDLYNIIFDNKPSLNPTDLQSCGKTISEMLKDTVEDSGYLVSMVYAEHRCDDSIHFKLDNQTETSFTATEGDDNNILEWASISYTPVSELRNKSICVFKTSSDKYAYVDTADITSLLNYGEKTTLNTVSDQIGKKEAYFNARNSKEYQPDEIYSYTIVVPYAPLLHLGELIEVISDNKLLNDVKTIKSLKYSYDNNDIPKTRVEIGCDELAPLLRIMKAQEELRRTTKNKSTWFSHTASAVEDDDLYVWDN